MLAFSVYKHNHVLKYCSTLGNLRKQSNKEDLTLNTFEVPANPLQLCGWIGGAKNCAIGQ